MPNSFLVDLIVPLSPNSPPPPCQICISQLYISSWGSEAYVKISRWWSLPLGRICALMTLASPSTILALRNCMIFLILWYLTSVFANKETEPGRCCDCKAKILILVSRFGADCSPWAGPWMPFSPDFLISEHPLWCLWHYELSSLVAVWLKCRLLHAKLASWNCTIGSL